MTPEQHPLAPVALVTPGPFFLVVDAQIEFAHDRSMQVETAPDPEGCRSCTLN